MTAGVGRSEETVPCDADNLPGDGMEALGRAGNGSENLLDVDKVEYH